MFHQQNNNNNYVARNNNNKNINYQDELAKALKLSQESYKKEQILREQAMKIQEKMKRYKQKQWDEKKSLQTMIECMKWKPMLINHGVGCGIQNLGNSCFMNATLQCLAYTPPFVQLLIQSNHSSQCKSNKFCALCEMEKVLSLMLMGKSICKPRNLFRNLPNVNDLLTPGCQEDAHEFLQSLLDKMEIAFDDTVKPYKKRNPHNPIRKLFTGATKTQIMCGRCKRKSITQEPFCCISLEVDDKIDLPQCLEIFTQDELMRGDDKYFCDNCDRKCIAHKRLTLSQLPPVLALHFKRFSVQFHSKHHTQGTTKKLPYHVEFPEILDFEELSDLIHEQDRKKQLIDSKYELYAVLVHSGPQLGYGHYYALIKSPDGFWFRMNDMDVIPVNTKHVLREQAYIVFYRKKASNLLQHELNQIKKGNIAVEEKENIQQIAIERNPNNNNRNNKNLMNDNDDKNACKVAVDLATQDYFAPTCELTTADIVIVDNNNNNNNEINGNGESFMNGKDDRKSYVQVPPMTSRPEIIANPQKLKNNFINNADPFQEVFWAEKEKETTNH